MQPFLIPCRRRKTESEAGGPERRSAGRRFKANRREGRNSRQAEGQGQQTEILENPYGRAFHRHPSLRRASSAGGSAHRAAEKRSFVQCVDAFHIALTEEPKWFIQQKHGQTDNCLFCHHHLIQRPFHFDTLKRQIRF